MDRYAYTNNSPLNYVDPSGHDGIPWRSLNPFSYNTLQGTVHFTLEAIGGATFDIGIALNWKAIKNTITKFDSSHMSGFDAALVVSTSATAGVELEGSGVFSLTGTDESVPELMNDNISTVLEGEIPINVSGCDGLCLGVSPTIDPKDPEFISEISYSIGGGYGAEIGVDVVTVTDWIAYGSGETTGGSIVYNDSPPDIGEMFNETWNETRDTFKHIWKKWKEYR